MCQYDQRHGDEHFKPDERDACDDDEWWKHRFADGKQ
jgi:hypothetical protein